MESLNQIERNHLNSARCFLVYMQLPLIASPQPHGQFSKSLTFPQLSTVWESNACTDNLITPREWVLRIWQTHTHYTPMIKSMINPMFFSCFDHCCISIISTVYPEYPNYQVIFSQWPQNCVKISCKLDLNWQNTAHSRPKWWRTVRKVIITKKNLRLSGSKPTKIVASLQKKTWMIPKRSAGFGSEL